MAELKALSVRQPWAWAIVAGYTDVINRNQRTDFRGDLLIHAGAELDAYGFQYLWEMGLYKALPPKLPRGGLVGIVEIVDCTKRADSPWAIPGKWHWVLRRPREFKNALPCPGHQGFFYPAVSARALGQVLSHAVSHRQKTR